MSTWIASLMRKEAMNPPREVVKEELTGGGCLIDGVQCAKNDNWSPPDSLLCLLLHHHAVDSGERQVLVRAAFPLEAQSCSGWPFSCVLNCVPIYKQGKQCMPQPECQKGGITRIARCHRHSSGRGSHASVEGKEKRVCWPVDSLWGSDMILTYLSSRMQTLRVQSLKWPDLLVGRRIWFFTGSIAADRCKSKRAEEMEIACHGATWRDSVTTNWLKTAISSVLEKKQRRRRRWGLDQAEKGPEEFSGI